MKIAWTKIPPELQRIKCDSCNQMVSSLHDVAEVNGNLITCHKCHDISNSKILEQMADDIFDGYVLYAKGVINKYQLMIFMRSELRSYLRKMQ